MRIRPSDAFPLEFLVICSCMLQIEEAQWELSSSFYDISSALSLCIGYMLDFAALRCPGAHCVIESAQLHYSTPMSVSLENLKS